MIEATILNKVSKEKVVEGYNKVIYKLLELINKWLVIDSYKNRNLMMKKKIKGKIFRCHPENLKIKKIKNLKFRNNEEKDLKK
jgi:hypothetical protein